MRLIDAYYKMKMLEQPVLRTNDVATYLDISTTNASKILSSLVQSQHIISLMRGLWGFPENLDALAVPGYLTAPFPSYVSLQSALYYHGMISQVPTTVYAISMARTKKVKTSVGVFSIHHVQPDFFFGFEDRGNGVYMATKEKALLDVLYLSQAKSRLFSALPEIELPRNFSVKKGYNIIEKISSANRKPLVKRRFEAIVSRETTKTLPD